MGFRRMGRRRRWGRGVVDAPATYVVVPLAWETSSGPLWPTSCNFSRTTSYACCSRLPRVGGLLFHSPFRQRTVICPHPVRCGQIANSYKHRGPGTFPSRSRLLAASRRQSNHGTCAVPIELRRGGLGEKDREVGAERGDGFECRVARMVGGRRGACGSRAGIETGA